MTEELLKASGYVYRNASRTPQEFKDFFGFDAAKYPKYFYITGTGLVVAKPVFNQHCKNVFDNRRYCLDMLTERLGV